MKDDFNEKVIARIKQHAKEGIYNMVVSGAFTPLLSAATKDFPIDQLIGTEIPLQNGVIQTDLKIYHIQAHRKNATIHSTLKGQHIDWENSYAYGDSFSDLSVLELVGRSEEHTSQLQS